jgi:TetR/AcrR family transcriptional repressor of lmrAB and yxaGH operons
MSETRDTIIETTSRLLEEQGYHATGLNQIVAESGAPKGSLYYYFPEGKDEISEEALRLTGRRVEENIRGMMQSHPTTADGLEGLLEKIAEQIEVSDFRAGGPITTVALESAGDNERLQRACSEIYDDWRGVVADRLGEDGVPDGQAERLSRTVIATIEGAIVLARTDRSVGPLLEAAASLRELLSIHIKSSEL